MCEGQPNNWAGSRDGHAHPQVRPGAQDIPLWTLACSKQWLATWAINRTVCHMRMAVKSRSEANGVLSTTAGMTLGDVRGGNAPQTTECVSLRARPAGQSVLGIRAVSGPICITRKVVGSRSHPGRVLRIKSTTPKYSLAQALVAIYLKVGNAGRA